MWRNDKKGDMVEGESQRREGLQGEKVGLHKGGRTEEIG